MSVKAYKFMIYPENNQQVILIFTLNTCRHRYSPAIKILNKIGQGRAGHARINACGDVRYNVCEAGGYGLVVRGVSLCGGGFMLVRANEIEAHFFIFKKMLGISIK